MKVAKLRTPALCATIVALLHSNSALRSTPPDDRVTDAYPRFVDEEVLPFVDDFLRHIVAATGSKIKSESGSDRDMEEGAHEICRAKQFGAPLHGRRSEEGVEETVA